MANKTNNSISDWSKGIADIFEREQEIRNKLQPNRDELNNIVGCARTIYESTILMKNSSDMAHQEIISFEMAQRILDGTKGKIKETIEYLEAYLKLKEE